MPSVRCPLNSSVEGRRSLGIANATSFNRQAKRRRMTVASFVRMNTIHQVHTPILPGFTSRHQLYIQRLQTFRGRSTIWLIPCVAALPLPLGRFMGLSVHLTP